MVCAITPVGLDHTDRLGETIAEIAREKAGIVKEGACTITAAQSREASEIIREVCRRRSSPLVEVGVDVRYELKEEEVDRQLIDIETSGRFYEDVSLPLTGAFQAGNAAMAVGVAEALAKRGMDIFTSGVRRGLSAVRLPGRMQVLERRPWLVLDGAHNVLAAKNLTDSLRRLFRARRAIVVLSVHRDKAVEDLCRVIAGYADEIVIPKRRVLRNRQADPGEVTEACRGYGTPARLAPSVAEAIADARTLAEPDDLVLVTGCFALVGEALEVLFGMEPEEIRSR
jgi:dihydrofolate synthase/folylpolyglutamate synthase